MHTKAYAAHRPTDVLEPWSFERREPRPDDVSIEILFCGVCHTDIHYAENDWGASTYPLVPGHEIIGRVSDVGAAVRKYRVGDLVGVGCLVDSCRECSSCDGGEEHHCLNRATLTYNGVDRHDGTPTYGGYSQRIVVSERFVVRVPDGMDPAAAAPILCAGITTYSPLKRFGAGPGKSVGVVGMGGLGHMAIKYAVAMGADVTVFTRSESKVSEAKRNGASRVVVSGTPAAMKSTRNSLDLIIDTVPVEHDVNPYLGCLRTNGVMVIVGQLTPLNPPVQAGQLVRFNRSLAGSLIGGMPETQEVLDFSAEKGVSCDVEIISIQDIADAWQRTKRGDVRYRFVIDLSSLQ
ncbi:MAG: NAD(P)-dependent alcohol dehydrogenase [Myxococcota bacterium]